MHFHQTAKQIEIRNEIQKECKRPGSSVYVECEIRRTYCERTRLIVRIPQTAYFFQIGVFGVALAPMSLLDPI